MLERASVDDVNSLQAYTICKMDQYIPTGRDITPQITKCARKTFGQLTKILGCFRFSHPFSNWEIWRVLSSSCEANNQRVHQVWANEYWP